MAQCEAASCSETHPAANTQSPDEQQPQAILIFFASALIIASLFTFGAGLEETQTGTGQAAQDYDVAWCVCGDCG